MSVMSKLKSPGTRETATDTGREALRSAKEGARRGAKRGPGLGAIRGAGESVAKRVRRKPVSRKPKSPLQRARQAGRDAVEGFGRPKRENKKGIAAAVAAVGAAAAAVAYFARDRISALLGRGSSDSTSPQGTVTPQPHGAMPSTDGEPATKAGSPADQS